MYIDQHRPQEALALLQPLHDSSARRVNATRLLLKAHQQLGNADQAFELTRQLMRRNAIDHAQALPFIGSAAAERLRAAGPEGFKGVWGELKPDEKVLPDVALAAAHVQQLSGHADEAGKTLEAALNIQLDIRLLNAYAQSPADQVSRRINKAEGWLKSNPDSPELLVALGQLCLIGQLWGPGERYLQRSIALKADVHGYALLGNLYDRLGRADEAVKYWRLASGVAGVVPSLHTSSVLPAADTRGDPERSSVDTPQFGVSDQAAAVMPMAASAADYVHDDASQGSAGESRQGEVPAAANSSFDEYFDSAPIPGVDVTQTSDRPRGGDHR